MLSILQTSGFSPEGKRILDFGCGAGRMLRCFQDVAKTSEIRGVDLSAKHIQWCQQHMSPPFRFATITTFPYLPFEDRYFDLIYAGSVFTHIADLIDSWLLELKRTLRPGGRLYLTVHDEHTLKSLTHPKWADFFLNAQLNEYDRISHFRSLDYAMFSFSGRAPHRAQVFYDNEYLRGRLEQEFIVLSVTPEAYGFQTGLLLKKPD
jgi:ubiquinone/menaquinone biosynthesis C-methylase UbiE